MRPAASLFTRLRGDGTTYSSWRRGLNAVRPVESIEAKHGNHIFIYRNVRTNQVVYSLTRSINNNAALKQLPFLGKKTVPAKIRKDLWLPFALVEFPSSIQGLNIYRKLREFRRLHETSYDLETITENGNLLPQKRRSKVLMNQRANTVADLAAVLLQDEVNSSQETTKRKKRTRKFWDKVNREKASEGKHSVEAAGMGALDGVNIRWADTIDKEYAEKWPEKVEHRSLDRSRYTAAFPAYEMADPGMQGPPEGEESTLQQAAA